MSPSWRDRLRVGLCPERLILARYRRGVRPALRAKQLVALESPGGQASWRSAVDALPAALASCDPDGCEVEVILSNHFVRYALLPWNAALKARSEWEALARHHFASVHGSVAEQWELRVSETAPRGPRIACAADKALLEALDEKLGAARVDLASVQPFLMSAFNRIRRRIGNAPCWLAIAEPGRLTLALLRGGAWRAIRSRRIDTHWRASLHEILEREAALLALGRPCKQVVVHSHEEPDAGIPGGFLVRDLTLPDDVAAEDRVFAMALG